MNKIAVIFGGAGFIGSYLSLELIKSGKVDEVVVADLNRPEFSYYPSSLEQAYADGQIKFVRVDVTQPIIDSQLPEQADFIFNLAAVHREPGHESYEYYATNLPGAEHICDWATKVDCDYLVFTSSISVYGASEDKNFAKSEQTTPEPNTPYGISKLAAERIHQEWQQAKPARKLMIVRPGVIFGAGERGNVTRMVRAILGNYFAFTGNQQTRKAGGYVKELCKAIVWMMDKQLQANASLSLFNFTMDPAPTVEEFALEISRTAKVKPVSRNVPFGLLLAGSYLISILTKFLRRGSNINPTRVRKLLRSNYIIPGQLKQAGYDYRYTLRGAMEDWKAQKPGDWQV